MAYFSVLDKYSDNVKKVNSAFSYDRDLFSKWTSIKITVLASVLDPLDWYNYLVEVGFIDPSHVKCKQCKGTLSLQKNDNFVDGGRFVCRNKIDIGSKLVKGNCTGTRTVRYNTWFYKSKLKVTEILLFTYFWWYKVPLSHVRREYSFSSRTIVDWASFCREVAIDEVLEHSVQIGGEGCIVEIDESKFGKSNLYSI